MSAAKKIRKPGVQLIGLRNIVVRADLQCRETENPHMIDVLAQSIQDGSFPPPAVVFDTPDGLLLAEGFTRYKSHIKACQQQMRCEVRSGSVRDAIIHSAGSNRMHAEGGPARMGPKDLQRAAEMLFADDEWWGATSKVIADHIGAKSKSIRAWRSAYAARNSKPLPDDYVDRFGRQVPRHRRRRGEASAIIRPIKKAGGSISGFRSTIGGVTRYLGKNEEAARRKAADLAAVIAAQESQGISRCTPGNLTRWLASRGIAVKFSEVGSSQDWLGSALAGPGMIIVPLQAFGGAGDGTAYRAGCLTALMHRELSAPGGRAIIVCIDLEERMLISIAKERFGIEFMTPEELVESLTKS